MLLLHVLINHLLSLHKASQWTLRRHGSWIMELWRLAHLIHIAIDAELRLLLILHLHHLDLLLYWIIIIAILMLSSSK